MSTIVVIKRGRDVGRVRSELVRRGITVRSIKGLKRHLHLPDCEPKDFPLASDPDVESFESGEKEVRPAQAITLNEGIVDGNWGLLRHTHRDPPWTIEGLKLPYSDTFSCVRDGTGVDVYLIDSGIDLDRTEEFETRATNVWEGISSGGAGDDYGHGTAVAAVAGGTVTGFARGSLLWSFKVFDSTGGGGTALIITQGIGEALSHYEGRAATNRPAVLNCSFESIISFAAAVADCVAAGMVVVAAAGNSRLNLDTETDVTPAEHADVICAGGLQMGDIPYSFDAQGTNYGTRVDILAAAQQVWLPALGSGYRTWNGTSFAAPHVAGAIACILQDYERLASADQVRQVKLYLQRQATWGRYIPDSRQEPTTRAILYLEPTGSYPAVPTLVELPSTFNPAWATSSNVILGGGRL